MKKLCWLVVFLTTSVCCFGQKLFAAKEKKDFGYVDVNGNWVIKPDYDNAYAFSSGLGRVKKGGSWSYIDTNGQAITAFRFHRAFSFEGDVARVGMVKAGGGAEITYGLIDRTGAWIAQPVFGHIRKFSSN